MKSTEELICGQCREGSRHLFDRLDQSDLRFINENKAVQYYKKGQTIFSEGSKAQGVFCLREGNVKIFKLCNDGREQITRIVFPGEIMGLKAFLSGKSYSVSATTLEDSVACFVKRVDFFQLMLKYPDLTNSLIVMLSSLMEEAETKLVSLTHMPVRQRLAETLLFLDQSFHDTSPGDPRPFLNISRTDIANIIGSVPETVIRLLSDFKEAGIIETRGRKIFLTDIPRLEMIASMHD